MTTEAALPVHTVNGEFLAAESQSRPPRFDPWRIAATHAMRELVDEVTQGALRTEAHFGLRKRARRPRDERVFRETVEAILCDVAYQHLRGHKSVRISRERGQLARASRYTSELLSKQLPAILDLLSERMGIIRQQLGTHYAMQPMQTEIAPGPWLVDRLSEHRITIYDTSRREGEELLMLKGDKAAGVSALVEYSEDDHTEATRKEIQTINSYLREADIEFCRHSTAGLVVDPRSRHLRRIFTRSSWFSGGRLFGGFWQNIGKDDRLGNTTINGDGVVSLDYRSMIAALAYARVGVPMPTEDAYTLPPVHIGGGESKTIPRGTYKKLLSAALFVESPLRAWPSGIPSNGAPLGAALEALERAHPAIAPLFYQGIGHALQYTESEILVDVLLELIRRDVPALPVHDCIVVAEGDTEEAQQVMADAFQCHAGAPVGIAIERAD